MPKLITADEALKSFDDLTRNSALLAASARANKGLAALAKELSAEKASPALHTQLKENNVRTAGCDLYVLPGFDPSRLWNVRLVGTVILGSFKGDIKTPRGGMIPTGIENATLSNVLVYGECLIKDVSILAEAIVEKGVFLMGCVSVTGVKGSTFGCGQELPIAIETGGREVAVFAEITVPVASAVAGRRAEKAFLKDYSAKVAAYAKAVTSDFTTLGEGAQLIATSRVMGSFIGAGAKVLSARGVLSSTLLSSAEEPAEVLDGALVKNSVLQWGSEVATMAFVDGSVMTEHSHAERHGKVAGSLIGPNTGIAEGEVTASLVGPFVGFHHQSLLIAAYWPEGKGNVAYGANVGSNHTSKAPDQEIWPGEGIFFGLGNNIKFPTDFSEAPYTIVASCVSALPQRMSFPFSLVNTPAEFHEGVSPAYNELIPGWVLSDNIFTIMRNERKYAKRNKAKRSTFDFAAFRPDTVELMRSSRKRLQAASGKSVYTDKDIGGIGKNFMSEDSRKSGIDAYTFYIRVYALRELKKRADAGDLAIDKALAASGSADWTYIRGWFKEEFAGADMRTCLTELKEKQKTISSEVRVSKEKDDKRGVRIIPDYAAAHAPASEDSFVKEVAKETEALVAEIDEMLKKL